LWLHEGRNLSADGIFAVIFAIFRSQSDLVVEVMRRRRDGDCRAQETNGAKEGRNASAELGEQSCLL
jgi:hypothetical protein